MNLVPQQNTGLALTNQIGLGFKLFGIKIPVGKWLKAGVNYVADRLRGAALSIPIPGVGSYLEDMIKSLQGKVNAFIDSKAWLNGLHGASDGEVTPQEENILNNWLTSQFTPFVEGLFNEITLAMQLPTPLSQVIAINAVLNKIDGAQDFYAVDGQDGLSQNAIDQRQYLVAFALEPVFKAAQDAVKILGLNVTTTPVQFEMSAYDFTPLFTSTIVTVVNGENYVLKGSGTGSVKIIGTTKPVKAGTVIDFNVSKDLIKRPTTVRTPSQPLPTTTAPIKTAVPVTVKQPTPVQTAVPVKQPTTPVPVQTAVPVTQPTTTTQAPVQQAPATETTNVDDVATAVTTPVATGSNTPATTDKTGSTGNKTLLYIGGALLFAAAVRAAMKKKNNTRSKSAKSKK